LTESGRRLPETAAKRQKEATVEKKVPSELQFRGALMKNEAFIYWCKSCLLEAMFVRN
jgi:hypothetical protein